MDVWSYPQRQDTQCGFAAMTRYRSCTGSGETWQTEMVWTCGTQRQRGLGIEMQDLKNVQGAGIRGRPRKAWKDCVEEDRHKLGLENVETTDRQK